MKKTISGPFLITRQPNRRGRELESNEVDKHLHQEKPRPQANKRGAGWIEQLCFAAEEIQAHREVMREAHITGT